MAFLNELTDTMKFESFVYGFIQSYNPIDLYKIPLSFTEEFLSILSRKKSNLKTINFNFLSLIDLLYERHVKKKLYVDLSPFMTVYYKKYKNYFDREIYDISGLYSFKDSVDELIRSTEHVVLCMPNGATSIEYFKTLSNHMHSAEKKGVPAYMEAEALDDLIESIANVYTLSYGNPLTQESKTRCLYNFNKHMEQYNRAKIMKFNPDK